MCSCVWNTFRWMWRSARPPCSYYLIDLKEQHLPPCTFISMHVSSLRWSTNQFSVLPLNLQFSLSTLAPLSWYNSTTGGQCSKMDLIIIISASKVHLGIAANTQHVLGRVVWGQGLSALTVFDSWRRQEVGCAAVLHTYLIVGQLASSPEEEGTQLWNQSFILSCRQ